MIKYYKVLGSGTRMVSLWMPCGENSFRFRHTSSLVEFERAHHENPASWSCDGLPLDQFLSRFTGPNSTLRELSREEALALFEPTHKKVAARRNPNTKLGGPKSKLP